MLRARFLALASLTLALTGPSAIATTWVPVKVKCPIGGKKFETMAMASNSYFGERPDGRRYSPSPIPPIDECPDNGFVIFDTELSKVEIAQLVPLVASPDYQALRSTETRHYRAWWLMEKLGRDPYARAIQLMFAGWETDDLAERKARYQSQFAAAVLSLDYSGERRDDWFWLRLRAANALRETSRFDEAGAILAATDLPERMPKEPDQLESAKRYSDGLRALIRDRNPHAEPANLIPPRAAVERCKEAALTLAETDACKGQAINDEIEEQRKWREAEAQTDTPTAVGAASDAAEAAAEAADRAKRAAQTPD